MFAVYKKEMRSYFINPIGYVFVGVFLAAAALLCSYTTLIAKSYDTSNYFTILIFAFIVLLPLLTMRLFAEERKLRTEQLLLTAPVTITGMVIGKYLAAYTMFIGTILVSCVNFIPLYVYAAKERANASYQAVHIGPNTPELIGCLIGIILIGAAFIAVGMFISALTENQLAAAVITVAVLLGMSSIGLLSSLIDVYGIRTILNWISVLSRYTNFANGIFDFASLLYYLSITFVFVFLTVRVYEKRRWG